LIPPAIGPYSISRELGRGGMGVVYAGQHQELGRWAAIKLLLEDGVGPDAQERFQRECEALGQLNHPGIVRVYESGQFQGRPFLALEFVEGAPLDELLAKSGPLEQKVAVEAMISICEAIAHAHDLGILHRDIKPANILWDSAQRPRVTDFGLAKDLGARSLTASGTMLGTPAYMPPEQAAGDKAALGPPADVYGLGATLFALLTGVAPFQGATPVNIVTQVYTKPAPPPSSRDSSIDAELDALVLRCLEKDPADRYPDARALASALRAYLAGEPTEGGPRRRGRGPLLIGIGVVLLLAGVGTAWGIGSSPPKATPRPDPLQLAEQAGRALRSCRTTEDLESWFEQHATAADAKDLARAQQRLANQRWDELVETYGVAGSDTLPAVGDVTRVAHYRAIRAWLAAHAETASPVPAQQARKALERLRSPGAVLAILPGTRDPVDRGKDDEPDPRQDPLFLSDDLLLVQGEAPTSLLHDLGGKPPRPLRLGLVVPDQPVDLERVAWLGPEVGLRALCSRGFLTTPDPRAGSPSPGPLLRLPRQLDAWGFLTLPRQTLVYGVRPKDRWAGGAKGGGFAALLPNSALAAPPATAPALQHLSFQRRVLSAVAGRHALYVAGGHHDTSKSIGCFVAELEVADGKLGVANAITFDAAGKVLTLSPDQDQVVVGCNRGGVLAFPLDEKGRLGKTSFAKLVPLEKDAKGSETLGGASIDVTGLTFLPDGTLLVVNDFYDDPGTCNLSAWSPAARRAAQTPGEYDSSSFKRVAPTWLVELQTQPRTIVLSPGRDLVALGTEKDCVWIMATPPSSP
jgi:predicted Ser/Thr protein kinase